MECETLPGMRIDRRYLGGRWLPGGRVVHPVKIERQPTSARFATCTADIVLDENLFAADGDPLGTTPT